MTATDKTYKGWPLLDEMPDGWAINKAAGSPLHSYVFVTNCKSVFSGERRTALLRVNKKPVTEEKTIAKQLPEISDDQPKSSKEKSTKWKFDKSSARIVNELARQRFKQKILADILIDLTICEIEGWSKREYINEIKKLVNSIGKTRTIESNQIPLDI